LKIEVTKQTRFILGGVLVGSLLGALGAMFLYSQRKRTGAAGAESRLAAPEGLAPQRVAALVWHTINMIREIADFGAGK